jgi:hypothetical protein
MVITVLSRPILSPVGQIFLNLLLWETMQFPMYVLSFADIGQEVRALHAENQHTCRCNLKF